MDHAAEAKRYRHMAEELRAKAGLMTHEEVCAQYLKLAEAYEGLANNEQRVAANLEKPTRAALLERPQPVPD